MPTTSTRLFLDFGTAYCKAATCKPGEPPVPLAIGEAVRQGRGDRHMTRTALFIARSGVIYFGEAAVDVAAEEERLPYDAIKDVLTNSKRRSDLDEPLPPSDNPTSVPLNKRHAITLFLAFLTQAALQALGDPTSVVRRSIAMPVFEEDKQRWVSDELTDCLAHAHALARHFGNGLFRSIDLSKAAQALEDGRRPQVVADPPTVAEPIAAVAGHLLHFTPDGTHEPFLMMVVDVGAGTTDIAMFAGGRPEGIVNVRHVKKSKVSLPWAGKSMDRALIDHLVGVANGGGRLRADLQREGNGEPIKEEIFKEHTVTRYGITISLEDFLQSRTMLEIVRNIQDGFDSVLRNVDSSFFIHRVVVRFSGGGHDLPFLADLVRSERLLGHTLVRMRRAEQQPGWRNEPRYSDLYGEVGGKFHRMAVALGGSYYCADSHTWLRLEDDVSSLGGL